MVLDASDSQIMERLRQIVGEHDCGTPNGSSTPIHPTVPGGPNSLSVSLEPGWIGSRDRWSTQHMSLA